MTEQASVCPTCGSDDKAKRGCGCGCGNPSPEFSFRPCADPWHNPKPAAAPRDPQKLVDALGRTLRNFKLSLVGKPVRDAGETIAEAESALKDWEENQ